MEHESRSLLLINQMAFYTQPSLAAIYTCQDSETAELIGSGTLLNLCGNTYLLTAGHIALNNKAYIGLTHVRPWAFGQVPLGHPVHSLDDHLDLCLVKIDARNLRGAGLVPLTSSKLSRTSSDIRNEILFLHGYPRERSTMVKIFDGEASGSLPYGMTIGKSDFTWFDDKVHFALGYTAESPSAEEITQPASDIPGGLTGSAVWSTNLHALGPSWKCDAAEIVGIVHHWDQGAQSLIATRIEVVREFLVRSLRREFAYCRWEKRGSPYGEDLDDWFAACEEIHDV